MISTFSIVHRLNRLWKRLDKMLVIEDGSACGAREGIRTPDLWYRKPTLYPAELHAQGTVDFNTFVVADPWIA